MPRFFFNIHNGNGLTEDEEGREFADAGAAREEAVKGVRSIIAEEAKEGRVDLRGRIEVTDEAGGAVLAVPFRDALAFDTGTLPAERRRAGGTRSAIGDVFEKHFGLIGELDGEDVAALHSIAGEVRDVARGEDVLSQGDRSTNSIVVIEGMLHCYSLSAQGKRQIHSFYIAGDAPCLETVHIDHMENSLGAIAASRIGVVAHAELFRVMEERPNLQALIWRDTLIQAAVFRAWLMRNSLMLAHGQMAHFFCEMMTRARAAGLSEGERFALPITQEELADALGMAAVHVNRTLMMLRTGGLVEFRSGRLIVLDWDRLVEIAEFDPYYLHLRR